MNVGYSIFFLQRRWRYYLEATTSHMSGRVRVEGVPSMCINYSLLSYFTDKPKDVRIKLSIINTDIRT